MGNPIATGVTLAPGCRAYIIYVSVQTKQMPAALNIQVANRLFCIYPTYIEWQLLIPSLN